MMSASNCLPVAFAFLVATASPSASTTSGNPAIVARAGATAILIWDAFGFLKDNQTRDLSQQAAEREVVSAAFGALAQKLPNLANSKTVRLLVLVQKPATGDNLIYRDTTFNETKTLLTMETKRSDALKHRTEWMRALAAGKVPPGLKIHWDNHLSP